MNPPLKIRDLDPATLNRLIAPMHAGVEVRDREIIARAACGDGVASTADRLNLKLAYRDNAVGLPDTLVVKTLLLHPGFRLGLPAILSLSRAVRMAEKLPGVGGAAGRALFVIVGAYQKYFPQAPDAMYEIESRFYREIRPRLEIEAPRVFGAEYDPRSRQFAVLMEDLSLREARFPTALESLPLETVRSTLRSMAQIHAAYWNAPALWAELDWVPSRFAGGMYPVFDGIGLDLIRYQVNHHRFKQDLVAPLERHVDQLWQAMWASQRLLQDGPQTLLHGDTHVGNTYVLPDGRGGLIDFQLLVKGHPMIDVSYYLMTALSTAQRRAEERGLIAGYLDRLRELGVDTVPDDEAAWRDHRLASLWGLVIGWLITPPVNYGEAITRANIERLSQAVADLDPFTLIEAANRT